MNTTQASAIVRHTSKTMPAPPARQAAPAGKPVPSRNLRDVRDIGIAIPPVPIKVLSFKPDAAATRRLGSALEA